MLLIRPVTLADVDPLLALAHHTGFGLTTLPRDRAMLERRVRESLHGFEKLDIDPPRGEAYLLIMEDTDAGEVVGTSGVVSKVGGFEPFYAYRIDTSVHESRTLGVRKEIKTLHLVVDHDGPCEIGSLFLHRDHRHSGNGRALSLVRFLLMADQPGLFDPVVIAEMRGVIDQAGHSAFWNAVGKHFFDLDFPKADYLSIVNKQFIGDLMPRHPIYIPLLPPEAQAVIGQVHDETQAAKHILECEGFTFSGMVDIFEAGPVLRCEREAIRTVRDSHLIIVRDVVDGPTHGPTHLLSNTRRTFRACQAPYATHERGLRLTREVAEALQVTPGDTVRHVPLHPPKPGSDASTARATAHAMTAPITEPSRAAEGVS